MYAYILLCFRLSGFIIAAYLNPSTGYIMSKIQYFTISQPFTVSIFKVMKLCEMN